MTESFTTKFLSVEYGTRLLNAIEAFQITVPNMTSRKLGFEWCGEPKRKKDRKKDREKAELLRQQQEPL